MWSLGRLSSKVIEIRGSQKRGSSHGKKKGPTVGWAFAMGEDTYFPLAPMETMEQRNPMWLVEESWCIKRRAPGASQ